MKVVETRRLISSWQTARAFERSTTLTCIILKRQFVEPPLIREYGLHIFHFPGEARELVPFEVSRTPQAYGQAKGATRWHFHHGLTCRDSIDTIENHMLALSSILLRKLFIISRCNLNIKSMGHQAGDIQVLQ